MKHVQSCLLTACFLAWAATCGAAGAEATDTTGSPAVTSAGAMDFLACARTAFANSPFLRKSAIEIDIRRLDLSDARWDYAPSLHVSSTYYITRPEETTEPFSLSADTGPYDFVQPYFTVSAAKQFTRIAVLSHLQTMIDGLHEMARIFLQLEAADRGISLQNDIVDLAKQNMLQVQTRRGTAGEDPIEARIAEKELEEVRIESEKLAAARDALADRLAAMMGIPSDQEVDPSVSNAYAQVIGAFRPEDATLEQAREHSTELAISRIRRSLQELNISAAYAKYLPSPFLAARTADPLNNKTDRGIYFAAGINLLVWDGFDRGRNVTRQKNVLRQYESDHENVEQSLVIRWKAAQNQFRLSSLDVKAAETREGIAMLKADLSKITHESGRQPVSTVLHDKITHMLARRDVVAKSLDRDLSSIYIRYLCGDLQDKFIKGNGFTTETCESMDMERR